MIHSFEHPYILRFIRNTDFSDRGVFLCKTFMNVVRDRDFKAGGRDKKNPEKFPERTAGQCLKKKTSRRVPQNNRTSDRFSEGTS